MNSKRLVLDAIHNKEVERIPWFPFAGCHAATLIGTTAEEYFKNEDHIINGKKASPSFYIDCLDLYPLAGSTHSHSTVAGGFPVMS